MVTVYPGVETDDLNDLFERVRLVEPLADGVHIDVADGKYVPSKTVLPSEYDGELPKDLFCEAHLMVEQPENYLDACNQVGFQRVVVHWNGSEEEVLKLREVSLQSELGMTLAFSIGVQLPSIELLQTFDRLMVMCVPLGFSGQQFDPMQLEVVRYLSEQLPDVLLEVDGGINLETAVEAKRVGADILVSTSYLSYLNLLEERYDALKGV